LLFLPQLLRANGDAYPGSYTNWCPNCGLQPDGSGGVDACVYLWSASNSFCSGTACGGKWDDAPCTMVASAYICEAAPLSFISGTLNQGLVAYYPFDGNARDQSGNGNNGEVHSATLTSDRFGNPHSAYNFDGMSSYIKVPNGSPFNFANNFSVSFWVKSGARQNNFAYMFYKVSHIYGEPLWVFHQYSDSLNRFVFQYPQNFGQGWDGFCNGNWNCIADLILTANQWDYYSITKQNKKISIYLNGNLQASRYFPTSSIPTTGNFSLFIGTSDSYNRHFNGTLDDIFIYNRTLTASEVLQLSQFGAPTSQPTSRPSSQPSRQPSRQPSSQPTSQPSFQPTTQPTSYISGTLNQGLVAYYPFDGNARDQSGNGNNGEVHNAFLAHDRFGNPNSAYRFDGSTSYIEIENGAPFSFRNNFSVSVWVNPAASQQGLATILDKSHYGGSSWVIIQSEITTNDYRFVFYSNQWNSVSSASLIPNQWSHLSFVKENSLLSIYLNGIVVAAANTAAILSNGDLPLFVGACRSPDGTPIRHFTGYIGDIFIYDRTLSTHEVLKLYQFGAPTSQPTGTPTSQPSEQPSIQPTCPSNQPTSSPSLQPVGKPTNHPSNQPTSQPTKVPSAQPTQKPSSQPTYQPTSRPSRKPSAIPSKQPSSQPSFQPSGYPTAQPRCQPSSIPTVQPTLQPFSRPTSLPSILPSQQPVPVPSGIPSNQPISNPSNQPTALPSVQPSCAPSFQPTGKPSSSPSMLPTSQPSSQPTSFPSSYPSTQPSGQPTSLPTEIPSEQPSGRPTSTPSTQPSAMSTGQPSVLPTSPPTIQPTLQPTGIPSVLPSSCPSSQPTRIPTIQPSSIPSQRPSSYPSSSPTSLPSNYPTCTPTLDPTVTPTNFPSSQPSSVPSLPPSIQPSSFPTTKPSQQPSNQPSSKPSFIPFSVPSIQPTSRPSSQPSCYPTNLPTAKPSRQPSSQPTIQPSRQPTSKPSKQPSSHPSRQPTSAPLSSSPTSIPTIITDSPTPLRNPSISAYPSQTRKPTRQPATSKPTAIPTVRPSFIPTSTPTQTISVFPSGNIPFKESLFFFGSYLPSVENIPNIYLTEETIGSSFIIFGFHKTEQIPKEIIIGTRNSQGLYSSIMNEAGLVQDQAMSRSAVPIGDFNGDTYEDLLICDPINSMCFVYFGHVNGLQNLQVSFAIKSDSNNLFGWSVVKLNDVNHDSYDDMAISALSSNLIYLFFGSKNTADVIVDPLDPSVGIKIIGSQNDQNTGLALSSAGDFNDDGFSDVLFSAIQMSPYQNVIYILFLNSKMMKQDIIIDNLTPNKDYFNIIAPLFSFAGFSLSNLGDINQDGFDDIIVGSIPYSGKYLMQKSYVIYGRNSSNRLSLSELTEEDGFIITGGGFMVAGSGDVNGDGIPDIMITNYQQWQGKGNSYITVYPLNVTTPPTFLPSSQPTSVPSYSPTSIPSIKVHDPTSTPTFQETTNEPVNKGTFPPFLEVTQLPSLAPKTSKPTRIPSIKSSTRSPTVKTDLPSVSPTRKPTETPTKRPTILPSTTIPSRVPTKHPISSTFPTSSPSILPTESLTTPFEEITIEKEGVYSNTPKGKANYIISGEGSFEITSNGGGKKIYTILPSKNVITITDFNNRYDQISLIHFPYLYSINDLVYRTNPLQIFLSSEQKLVLSSMDASELTEDNFIFQKDNEDHKRKTKFRLDLSALVSLGILIGCVGIFGCVSKLNKEDAEDERKMFVENVRESDKELNDNLSSDFGSLLLSSSDGEGEDEDDEFSITNSSNRNAEESGVLEDDWHLFSSLKSFFSSENDEEKDDNSLKTPNDDEFDDDGIDVEGNYHENDDDSVEGDISFIQQLFNNSH
jgi:hypothetical protein